MNPFAALNRHQLRINYNKLVLVAKYIAFSLSSIAEYYTNFQKTLDPFTTFCCTKKKKKNGPNLLQPEPYLRSLLFSSGSYFILSFYFPSFGGGITLNGPFVFRTKALGAILKAHFTPKEGLFLFRFNFLGSVWRWKTILLPCFSKPFIEFYFLYLDKCFFLLKKQTNTYHLCLQDKL